MEDEVSAGHLAQLLGITPKTLGALAKNGIAVKCKRRGTYVLEASVGGYCKHLRAMAAGRGGEDGAFARDRLGAAQSRSHRDQGEAARR
jgi:phage terminase Nu1 subunit (DNA packaging protein)